MELCNEGTLKQACREGLPDILARLYTLKLLEAVNELHLKQIIHRDIKPENIFLSGEKRMLKLGDFG